jgi:4a-hydroxytetrahydrobiopterin dehydratase
MALLTPDEIENHLAELDDWRVEDGAIVKEVKRGDFAGSVELVDEILPVAEGMNHHPDLAISWDTVTITIVTHSEGGLTDADFRLAAQIDKL